MAATTRRTIKTERLETKRTDLPWPLLHMCSVDNNKTTVCHLAIPREVSRLLWYGATGRRLRSPLVKGDVARARKIMQGNRNCPFERLEWSVFFENSFVP